LILQFSHPRLAAELETTAHVMCAWGGEPVMQRAVGRVLLREVSAAAIGKNAAIAPRAVQPRERL
jgi:hypothetical protein